ncbi:hypothetical protein T09_1599 [Trichinella sp. T9]|nr:hypothetical protein T09_1599 [Trichinella sp. T9]
MACAAYRMCSSISPITDVQHHFHLLRIIPALVDDNRYTIVRKRRTSSAWHIHFDIFPDLFIKNVVQNKELRPVFNEVFYQFPRSVQLIVN